jgi:peroxiredoxin
MSLRTWLLWGVLLAGALAITYTWAPRPGAPLVTAEQRETAPDFKLTDASGKEVKLSDYKDQVVLLNFWATWCAPCKIEIPWFMEFETEYKNRGFAVLGVSYDNHGWEDVRPYLTENKINYMVLAGAVEEMPEPYKSIETLPTTLLIDRQGRIAARHTGLVSKGTYESGVRQLLEN